MVKKVIMVVSLMVLSYPSFGVTGSRPDYKCQEAYNACEKRCDDSVTHQTFQGRVQDCLDRCQKSFDNCTDRQDKTDECSEAFMSCIEGATGSQKEACRKAYMDCKNK